MNRASLGLKENSGKYADRCSVTSPTVTERQAGIESIIAEKGHGCLTDSGRRANQFGAQGNHLFPQPRDQAGRCDDDKNEEVAFGHQCLD